MLNNSIIDRIKLPFRKEKELFSSLREILGFYPRHIELYKLALMHKSIARRNAKGKPVNNERLEFLGDAVLDAVVGDIVYRHFEGKREGFLTNTRSKLVQRDTLNKLAQEMGINRLILSSGHSNSHNNYMGGNAFEALVGAIYLDRGYKVAQRFICRKIIDENIKLEDLVNTEKNFKSRLIEWTQKYHVSIEFELIDTYSDADNNPIFKTAILLGGIFAADATGYSKKESHQGASKKALDRVASDTLFREQVLSTAPTTDGFNQ